MQLIIGAKKKSCEPPPFFFHYPNPRRQRGIAILSFGDSVPGRSVSGRSLTHASFCDAEPRAQLRVEPKKKNPAAFTDAGFSGIHNLTDRNETTPA
jgi:hypothetical protein